MGVSWQGRRSASSGFVLGMVWLMIAGRSAGADFPPAGSPLWAGSGSCAATACHAGRREPLDLKGSEYTFSEAYDPHAKAYSVLFDDRSLRIEKSYRRLADLESSRPFEDDACLRCHVHQGFDSKARRSRTPEFAVADGAGCEGCHGPAGKWLVPHVQYGWKGLDDRQKWELYGMRPTKDLLARGSNCTECHVGLGLTDVNHDLIAAGHPRLNFEYGSQLAKLPKHWRIEEDQARHPDYEAKVWALGQLLTAKASLDLLASRAARSIPDDSDSPWPEFAEYSCFSCHHDLVPAGWPSANTSFTAKVGSLQWATWTSPMAKVLFPVVPGLELESAGSAQALLRAEMARTLPDPALVARRSRAASEEIGRLAVSLNRGRITPSQVRLMLAAAIDSDDLERPLDWDRAARQYLAIVAFDKTLGEREPGRSIRGSRTRLEALLKDLDLPQRAENRPGLYDSPKPWKLDQIKADFEALLVPPTQP